MRTGVSTLMNEPENTLWTRALSSFNFRLAVFNFLKKY